MLKYPLTDFIEACNLLQLKATISCERKLVFDKLQKSTNFTAKATSTPVATEKKTNLDMLIEDLEQEEENVEYHLKEEDSGQILEVYEISNIEDGEMAYETNEENEDMSEERYELLNVVSDTKDDSAGTPRLFKPKKRNRIAFHLAVTSNSALPEKC